MDKKFFKTKEIKNILKKILEKYNANKEILEDISSSLILTSLRGIDTHGISQIFNIIDRVNKKRSQLIKKAKIIKNNKNSAVVLIDGYLSPGQHSASFAARESYLKAKKYGIGIAVVKNSTHFGACTPYVNYLTKKNMIAFVGSNSAQSMLAFKSNKPNLGNNPFGFGGPIDKKFDFIFDFSSGVMSFGKLNNIIEKRLSVPKNAFKKINIKKNDVVYEISKSVNYVALPFGDYKGASIAMMIEILSGILSSGNFGNKTELLKKGKFFGPSHFVIAIDPKKFDCLNFSKNLKSYIFQVRKKNLRLPGFDSNKIEKKRRKNGIPLSKNFEKKINEIKF